MSAEAVENIWGQPDDNNPTGDLCTHGLPPAAFCPSCEAPEQGDSEPQPQSLNRGALSSVPLGRRMAAEELKGRFIFAEGIGWLRWDGTRWASSSDKEIAQVAASWAERMLIHLIQSGAPDEAVKTALKYREIGPVRNLISGALTAQGEASILVRADQLDRHPHLLNTPTGTVNLTDGSIRPPSPDDLITKITGAGFRADAMHDDWNKALEAVTDATRDYLSRSVGAAATGHPSSDDRMEIHAGGGENGKTTIMGSVRAALGDYAVTVPDDLVSAHASTQHPTVMMPLRGARFAVLEELPDGHTLNVARIKKIIGTPTITARAIGKDYIEFPATHTLYVTTNYLPLVTETDHGTWRRLVRIPYPHQYGKDRPVDHGLRERCRHGREQQEAVLAWIVEGARRWYADSRTLGPLPAEIADSVREWRADTDLLFAFTEENVTFHPGSFEVYERTEELRAAFNDWLKPPNRPWSARTFAERIRSHPALIERGAEVGKHAQTRQSVVWGVVLKTTTRWP